MYLFELWFSPDLRPGMGLQDHTAVLFSVLKTLFIYGCVWALMLCLGFVPAYGLSLAAVSRAILVVMHRLLIVVASLVVEHRLQGMWASVFAAYGLSSHISWVLECGLSSCEAQA